MKNSSYFAPGWKWHKVDGRWTVRRRLKWLSKLSIKDRLQVAKVYSLLERYDPHQDNKT